MTGESRKALIIANSRYNDSKLARLSAPDVDARALEEVLRDTKVGFFDTVTVLRDKTHSEVRQEIFRLFHHAKRDDTLLLYFTGHGVLDNDGRLYLAVSDTKTDELLISGIPANFISDTMDRSRSRRQLLVLDCCHSGAFARGSRNSLERSVGTKSAFEGENGRGRFIMTATDELQYAWEGDDLIRGDGQSRFSYHFVEGLRSGKADREQNGYITVDDLYDYVFEQVKADSPQNKPQTPRLETYRKEGSLLVAKNLHTYPKEKQPPPRRVGGLVTLGDLRTVLDDVFEAEQIENMAFDLRLDERSLGQTKSAKIRSLLRQLDQQNRLTELLNWLHRNTPELFAEVFGKRDAVEMEAKAEPPAQPRSEPQMLVTTPEHLRSKTTGTKA
ncbi:MAG: caspase family protein, partial [Anaerolineales bacterium]|nr:caspase family protein [Anaerolineales bacterium]